jgi:hypothetical protein
MELNLPESAEQPEVIPSQPSYRDASSFSLPPITTAPPAEPVPLIPVLRKPRILVGRLVVFSITSIAILCGAGYGSLQGYRYLVKPEATVDGPDSITFQRFTVATSLNSVPFLFSYDSNSEVVFPTKTKPQLTISLVKRQLQSNGKDVFPLRVTILDNVGNKSSNDLASAHQRSLGDAALSVKIATVGIGIPATVSRAQGGASTTFASLSNGTYIVIEQPYFTDDTDRALVTKMHNLFIQSLRFE